MKKIQLMLLATVIVVGAILINSCDKENVTPLNEVDMFEGSVLKATSGSSTLQFNNGYYGFPSSPGNPSWFINGANSGYQPVTGDGIGGSIGAGHNSEGYFYFDLEDTSVEYSLKLAFKYLILNSDAEVGIYLTNGTTGSADEVLLTTLEYSESNWLFSSTFDHVDIGDAINSSTDFDWGDDLYIEYDANYVSGVGYSYIDYVQLLRTCPDQEAPNISGSSSRTVPSAALPHFEGFSTTYGLDGYEWSCSDPYATIISGQNTNVAVYQFTTSGTKEIRCVVTNDDYCDTESEMGTHNFTLIVSG